MNSLCFSRCILCASVSLWLGCPVHAQDKLTIEQSIVKAWAESPRARAARAERDAALAGVEREKPVARPNITATAQVGTQTPQVTLPLINGSNGLVVPNQFGLVNLTVEQTLWRAGRTEATQRYNAQKATAELSYRKALGDVAIAIRKAAIDVGRAEAGVGAAQEGLKFVQQYAASVGQRIAAGFAKPVDAETVKAQVAEAQTGLAEAENGLELAKLNFNRLLGREIETAFTLEAQDELPEIPTSTKEARQAAYRNRLELVLLERGIEAARAGAKLARLQDKPTLGIRGYLTEQTRTVLVPEFTAGALLEIKIPFGESAKARQDAKEANAQADKLAAQYDEAKQGIAVEIEAAWRKMKNARQKITLAEERLRGQLATYTVTVKEYEVGRGTVIAVQASGREVDAARFAKIGAQFDLQQAFVEFQAAQGAYYGR